MEGKLTVAKVNGNTNFRHVTLETASYVRLLFYGGAKNSSDNSAFYYASLNVQKDYNNDGNIKHIKIETAKQVVDIISNQKGSSIQSIDFFSHGDMLGLYFIKGSSTNKTISQDDVKTNKLNSSLYLGSATRFVMGSDVGEDSKTISEIDFSKFSKSCKIEIHGCLTAHDMYVKDNICEELSELLYNAGKTASIVIGHTEKANPNIKGSSTKNSEQDYRHGERQIFNNGKVISTTKRSGRITANEISKALKNK